jgi:hypothetical protein
MIHSQIPKEIRAVGTIGGAAGCKEGLKSKEGKLDIFPQSYIALFTHSLHLRPRQIKRRGQKE